MHYFQSHDLSLMEISTKPFALGHSCPLFKGNSTPALLGVLATAWREINALAQGRVNG